MKRDDSRFAWWFRLSDAEREGLDAAARESILDLPRYPFWAPEITAEILAWAQLEADVTTAHASWLEGLHRRAMSRGRTWGRHELLRQSRLAGDLTTPPPHLTGETTDG
ncbi:hypothetical protein [Gordonia iterans]